MSARRGRPLSARRGALREGRLALIETLRAAAPWQGLRRARADDDASIAVRVRADDFRITRFRERRETTAIFVVDASGSSAMQRLGEVKGAIELLLADCYVRRDSVALVAFRGKSAEILLPPTRSLARAKRLLAALPGGGGTPLAHGLDTAAALAESVKRKGQTPLLVLLTDGRGNIDRTGAPGRAQALDDALDAARRLRGLGLSALAIDSSAPGATRVDAPTRKIAEAMNGRYLKMPVAQAAMLSEAVRAAAPGP
jgi:magnesium chelatase subunit D